MTKEKEAEPPSYTEPLFMIGQDSRGNWVVQELNGTRGGLFVDRTQALRFVRSETEHRPQLVVMISGILELDMTCSSNAAHSGPLGVDVRRERRVA
jgi:hypothetical protein